MTKAFWIFGLNTNSYSKSFQIGLGKYQIVFCLVDNEQLSDLYHAMDHDKNEMTAFEIKKELDKLNDKS